MSTDEIADFGCTKNELIEAVHAGANRDDVARIEGAVWRLFDRVSGLRYFMDARNSLLAELENEKRQTRAAAARLSELERENAALREALRVLSWHYEELATMDGDVSREQLQTHDGPLKQARAALAGSGER
jgi:predicted nuclease with TOPRIM domain